MSAPTFAGADTVAPTATTGCPPIPAAYTGTDTVVAAISQQDADADQACTAITTAEHDAAQVASGQVVTALSQPLTVTEAGTQTVADPDAQTVAVDDFPTTQTVESDQPTLQAADAEFLGLHQDLWALSGIVVGVFTMLLIVWKVWP